MVYKIPGSVPASEVRAQNWGSYASDDLVTRCRANLLKACPCNRARALRFLQEDYFFPTPKPTCKNHRWVPDHKLWRQPTGVLRGARLRWPRGLAAGRGAHSTWGVAASGCGHFCAGSPHDDPTWVLPRGSRWHVRAQGAGTSKTWA